MSEFYVGQRVQFTAVGREVFALSGKPKTKRGNFGTVTGFGRDRINVRVRWDGHALSYVSTYAPKFIEPSSETRS